MKNWVLGLLVVAIVAAAPGPVASPALGAAQEREDQRERTVGVSFVIEKELETDRTIDTWIYVFCALMVLSVGWLCFKPTRTGQGKSGKFPARAASKKGNAAKNRPNKPKK